jgi:hypothetical protein
MWPGDPKGVQKMAPESRGKVRTQANLEDYGVFPRDGFVLPHKMTANAELTDGPTVTVEIEVTEGRARARTVMVTTSGPGGIGWTMLANLPIRDIVATAVLDRLMRARPFEGGLHLEPIRKSDADEAREIVQGAVGYNPRTEGFRRVS